MLRAYLLTGLLGSSIPVVKEDQDGGEDSEEGTCEALVLNNEPNYQRSLK